MSFRRLSFTERRRRRLAKKVDRLDRLETRNTITEPISVTGIAISAMRGAVQLGFIFPNQASNALSGLRLPTDVAKQVERPVTIPIVFRGKLLKPIPDLGTARHAGAAGGSSSAATGRELTARNATKAESNDWLTLSNAPAASANDAHGISTPWHPAKGAGGGAALPPRGGSNASGPARASARGAITPLILPASTPAASNAGGASAALLAAVAGASSPGTAVASGTAGSVPVNSDIANAVSQPIGPRKGPGIAFAPAIRIVENPSSLPSNTTGNWPFGPMLSFPYFGLYTLDYIQGNDLVPNGYQQATLGGNMDLRAQVSGGSGMTFSWNTSNLSGATSISGASTFDLTFTWPTSNLVSQYVDPVTLTATNGSSQHESQTYYFVIPTGTFTGSGSAGWPNTISPDTVLPGAPVVASDGVSIDANSGALDADIPLPSYNPNIGALDLTYNSTTSNPMPIILVPHILDPTQSVPTKVNATLTFNSNVGTTYYYNTSTFIPGDVEQIALQATGATGLSTGRYSYSVQVVDQRSTNTTFTYTGTATVLNQSSSTLGDGWTLGGLEKITSASGGVILNVGDNGETLWFSGSPGGGGGNYTSPSGDFSTLTLNANGTYVRTLPTGDQITFNSGGYETSTVDLNSQRVTYSYDGSNNLFSIKDNYGGLTTFSYSGGYLQSILDPAGRLATFTISSGKLTAVQQADHSTTSFTYDSSGRMTNVQDARSNSVTITYDSAERVGTITRPDSSKQLFSAYQEQGWTNSGTSGSPAAATLLAQAVSTFTDANGNAHQMAADWMGLGRVVQSTDPLGNATTFDVNNQGLATVVIDPLNRISQYQYDASGNITKQIYPDGTDSAYTYNSYAEPLAAQDANGHATSYTYSGTGNLTGIQDPLHNRTTLTYTSTGRVQSVTDANSHTTTVLYDSQDRATTVQFPDGTTTLYSYDSQGDATKVVDGRGNATTYAFDALNREIGSTDALIDIATLTYDSGGNLTKDQEPTPAGQTARTTTYAYDSLDRLTTATNPLGNQAILGYDGDGNTLTVKDSLGRITTTVFDALDRATVVIDPMSGRTTTTYDADGEALTVTDPLSRATTVTYSVRGWAATVTDPMGYLVTYTYSATGKDLGVYQTQGTQLETSSKAYDADDRLISDTDGNSHTTSYGYDGMGNRISVTDANNNTTTIVYDSRNRAATITDALGHSTVIGYDGSGNQQTVTDALGHTNTVLYDALSRATTMINAISGTTTITYDAAGRQTSLTDPVGNKTQWAYDAADRVATLTLPNSATVTYVYDVSAQ